MKQNNWITIAVATVFSLVVSIVATNLIFGRSSHNAQVVSVPTISAYFPKTDPRYFNKNSIDPVQLIEIGNGVNPVPFNQPSQQ